MQHVAQLVVITEIIHIHISLRSFKHTCRAGSARATYMDTYISGRAGAGKCWQEGETSVLRALRAHCHMQQKVYNGDKPATCN